MSAPRIVAHRTRVALADGRAGVVLRVESVRRRLVAGERVDEPAKLRVILDSGERVTVHARDVTVES